MNPTRETLMAIMQQIQGQNPVDEEQKKDYRYVIYARKSTDQEDKQERSLGDQVIECQEFAERNNLKVIGKPIQEAASAKEPDIRPQFKQMIEDLKVGKYDGVIAWHPNRLSRNMREAGDIIDLLDKGTIKDLKFVSFTFQNNPSGKMLLGITFVLSKQYSDQLSDDITRGNKHSIEEGKYINRAKHGYYKDGNQHLQPDADNFLLVKDAFRLRLEGKTYDEIAQHFNEHGYKKVNKDGSRTTFTMTKQRVQLLLRDPVYAGIVVYGKKSGAVDLTKVYGFVPAVSIDDFYKVNNLKDNKEFAKLARKYHKGENVKSDLMRGMVTCADCEEIMLTGITNKPKQGRKYFYFRCCTEGCPRNNKSVRAKIIVSAAKNFLAKKPFSSEAAYNHYVEEMASVSARRSREVKNALFAKKNQKIRLEQKLVRFKDLIVDATDDHMRKSYEQDFKKTETDIAALDQEIEREEARGRAIKAATLSYPNFLELMEKLPQIMASADTMSDLNFVIKKVFSNFLVRGKNVEKITLNKPFDALCDPKVMECARGGT